jgi:chromosomal replication initiation ATPase DnaA
VTASPPRQLIFDLPVGVATGAGDFLTSSSNAAAVELIDSWPDWREPSVVLVGPEASGKSHLAAVWSGRAQARVCQAMSLGEETIAVFQHDDVRALVIEDIDRGVNDQRVLFHLLNYARETKRHMLLTSRTAPGDFEVELPDLRSRLRALAMISIAEPDDALLSAVLVKLCADRQLTVEPTVISYLLRHMDRSFAAASATIANIDAIALARHSKITRAIAAQALARFSEIADETE